MYPKWKLPSWLLLTVLLTGASHSALAVYTEINPPMDITHFLTVQPIVVSDGGNTATFFGTSTDQAGIEAAINQIWAQAGISVNFLAENTYDNSFANNGTSGAGTRPQSDLDTIVSNADAQGGILNSDPNVLNMFFVNHSPGHPELPANNVAGLADQPGNDSSMFVGTTLVTGTVFNSGLTGWEIIASVVAHEIGHNLGLPHIPVDFNLMLAAGSGDNGQRLNTMQIQTALASPLVSAVPLPAAAWLFGTALIGLVGIRRQLA